MTARRTIPGARAHIALAQTPLGPAAAAWSGTDDDARWVALQLGGGLAAMRERLRLRGFAVAGAQASLPRPLTVSLDDVFAGGRVADALLDVRGTTTYQQRVWSALRDVRAGTTTTYGALARRLGRPNGARAVGGAVGANPLLMIVPCHRVVAADGGAGGFSAGLPLKRALLAYEGVDVAALRWQKRGR